MEGTTKINHKRIPLNYSHEVSIFIYELKNVNKKRKKVNIRKF